MLPRVSIWPFFILKLKTFGWPGRTAAPQPQYW